MAEPLSFDDYFAQNPFRSTNEYRESVEYGGQMRDPAAVDVYKDYLSGFGGDSGSTGLSGVSSSGYSNSFGGLGSFLSSFLMSRSFSPYGGGYSPYGGGYGGMYGGGYGMSPFMGFGGYSPYYSPFGGSSYGSRGLMGLGLGSYGMGYSPYGMGYGSIYSMMPYGLGGYVPQSYGSGSQSQGSAPV